MSTEAIKEALKKAAVQIRDEKIAGANTALRVGSMLLAIIESLFKVDINELAEHFLRKDQPDTASGIITFLKGLLVGSNGSGFTVLEDGSTQAVVDRLYVKVKAYFDALEVKKKTYVGGEQIITPAGMRCVRVEELSTAYRCYFKSVEDGVEIDNTFTVGQLAICQECNIKVGVAQHVGNRFYWREVIGVGTDYIDLSKSSCATDSDVPAAGDDIVGLGHIDDIVRQSAIVLSSVGSSSPSVIFYQGIDSFSLDGKEVIALEYDRTTGHAKVRIYGSTYIGNKDGDSYVSYDPNNGLEVKAKKIILGSGESLDNVIDGMAENVANVATQLDGSIEIWQGDYASTEEYLLADKVAPSNDWDTDVKMNEHLGDYLVLTNGACYEFQYDEAELRYVWTNVTDQYLIAYLRTLDTKKAVYKITDDTLPLAFFGPKAYNVGDLWVNAVYPESGETYNDETLVCITPKTVGEQFDITHWTPADGTKKKLLEAGIDINTREIAFTAEQFKFKNLLGELFAVLEEIDGIPTIRTELLNITGKLIAEKILASGLDIGGKFVVSISKDGTASVKLIGEIEADSGRIGGLKISGQALTNEGYDNDAYIIMRNDANDVFCGIGGNVLPALTGTRAVARFQNNYGGGSTVDEYNNSFGANYGMVLGARNARYNIALALTGGFIQNLALRTDIITNDKTLDCNTNVAVTLNNSNSLNITLPVMHSYDDGHVLIVMNQGSYGGTLYAGTNIEGTDTRNSFISCPNSGNVTQLTIDKGITRIELVYTHYITFTASDGTVYNGCWMKK